MSSCPPVLLSSCLPAVLQSSFLLSIKKNNMKKFYNKHDRKRDPKHVQIMTKLIVIYKVLYFLFRQTKCK